ncbi:MAG TPA: UDP-3-O-(3-hydroxymyristoyl)glucosamine N-acyltransferase [Candidatus Saccharimonadales bacterium]|jgi:UDP-3-O-[3-hydroxymyristoyl] glucosamine N-acyltransferase|nr:UDP-3-O-(3-hydroxymyristoyl)glucosamine N-acyltransferase [Candidatus Saccharimonadales bacterium]
MTRTMKELADFLGCPCEGDGAVPVSGVASTVSASAEDLIYVESVQHLERAAASASKCVVIAPGLSLNGKVLLRADKPKLAFARAAEWLLPAEPIAKGIHPTAIIAKSAQITAGVSVGPYAVIEEDVQLGAGTEIGAFCFVGRGSIVGKACRFYPRVTLYAGTSVENHVIIHSGTVIGSDGFGFVSENGKYRKFPQVGEVEIGDNVEIGANTTIDRGSLDRTVISSGVKLDNLVHVAHNVNIGENTVIAAQTGISGSSVIGKSVIIGGQVGIADHCEVRDGAVVGAQAGIPTGKIIRGGGVVWGTPARSLEKFKEQFAWLSRLPELAERIKKLENIVSSKDK